MKKIYEDLKKVLESKTPNKILVGILIIILAFSIFFAGMAVGFHKASFGRAWGENYERNFGMRPGNIMLGRDNFPNANGAIGKIIKIELPTLIVQDKDNVEKVILATEGTKIQKAREALTINNLKVDDYIVVVGNPNEQGQVEAKFIRIIPSPELMPPSGFIKK